ncbi:MAG: flagellar brake protein [Gammaproteobacteria bacterium]|nr:flagellar brake protein [Gammaproteobacteria bacterium]
MTAKPADDGRTPVVMPDVGTRISVESARLSGRMWSRIIGWKDHQYLLIETPEAHLPLGITAAFSEDDSLTLRYMNDGMIIGFRTPVLGRMTKPYPLTVVAYPNNVQTHSLRRHPRLNCYLPCRVQLGETEFSRAVIRDVSLNGCRIRIPAEELVESVDLEDTPEGRAETPVTVHVQLPEDTEPQVVAGRLVSFDREAAYAMLRLESTAELHSLVEFVGMFTTRFDIADIA